MNATPRKKTGIEVPMRDEFVTVTSIIEYLFLAESTPTGMAIDSEHTSPMSCSSSVAQTFCAMSDETSPLLYEYHRLSVKRSISHCKYWSMTGLSRPK